MADVLMVIANNWFQDYEFWIPFDIFNDAGLKVTIAAGRKWTCIGIFGSKTIADKELIQIKWWDYDIVVFIWWWWAFTQYLHDENYLRIWKEAKKMWAICIAPMILSEAWIFVWKNVTWRNQNDVQKKFIQDNGGFWVDKSVVVSWNIVTANGPDAALEFAEKCLEMIY